MMSAPFSAETTASVPTKSTSSDPPSIPLTPLDVLSSSMISGTSTFSFSKNPRSSVN
jgi:hypothetical protein